MCKGMYWLSHPLLVFLLTPVLTYCRCVCLYEVIMGVGVCTNFLPTLLFSQTHKCIPGAWASLKVPAASVNDLAAGLYRLPARVTLDLQSSTHSLKPSLSLTRNCRTDGKLGKDIYIKCKKGNKNFFLMALSDCFNSFFFLAYDI